MCYSKTTNRAGGTQDGDSKSFRRTARAGGAGGCMGHGKERFSTQEMANALAVSTPTAITLLRRLEGPRPGAALQGIQFHRRTQARAWSACPGARYVVGADITLRHVSPGGCGIFRPGDAHANPHSGLYAYARLFFGRSPRSSASCARSCPGNRFWASACPFPASSAAGRTSSCAPTRFPFRDCGPMNSNNISACPAA